jgi:hypothetical protein
MDSEFEYLKECIKILIDNYDKDFKEVDEDYNKKIRELKNSGEYYMPFDEEFTSKVTVGDMIESQLNEPFTKLELFSGILVESLLVKHLSYVEKILVDLSYQIQKLEKIEVSPDSNNKKKFFTDMIEAVDYITKATNKELKIKSIKQWEILMHLRKLRHRIAHGNNIFEYEEGLITDINKELHIIKEKTIKSIPGNNEPFIYLITKKIEPNRKNVWTCSLTTDIKVLKELNTICSEFITVVKRSCIKRYIK